MQHICASAEKTKQAKTGGFVNIGTALGLERGRVRAAVADVVAVSLA